MYSRNCLSLKMEALRSFETSSTTSLWEIQLYHGRYLSGISRFLNIVRLIIFQKQQRYSNSTCYGPQLGQIGTITPPPPQYQSVDGLCQSTVSLYETMITCGQREVTRNEQDCTWCTPWREAETWTRRSLLFNYHRLHGTRIMKHNVISLPSVRHKWLSLLRFPRNSEVLESSMCWFRIPNFIKVGHGQRG
jgi:hypothetical protein